MRKKLIFYIAFFLTFLLIMSLSKPSPDTFNDWLANQHDIKCDGDNCLYNNSNEIVVYRKVDNFILINKVRIILEDEKGVRTLIEGIGAFGKFRPFTFTPVYNPFIDIYKY
mgnify:CR=1 FL=1